MYLSINILFQSQPHRRMGPHKSFATLVVLFLICDISSSMLVSLTFSSAPWLIWTACSTHIKSHTKPHKCPVQTCSFKGSRYRHGRDRHVDSRHRTEVPDTRRFYCPIEPCKYSESYGRGFARADGLKRHTGKAHKEIGMDST